MSDQRNLILAIVASVAIILGFQYFYEAPRLQNVAEMTAEQSAESTLPTPDMPAGTEAAPGAVGAPLSPEVARSQALAESVRLPIINTHLAGTLALTGGRIDDLILTDYQETIDPDAPDITLLSPQGVGDTNFAQFGWVPADSETEVPGGESQWQSNADRLAEGNAVEMRWSNDQGLDFIRRIDIDDDYMFTLTRQVSNTSDAPVTLYPYSLISRWGTPDTMGFYILHEGPIGVFDEKLEEIDYDDLVEDGNVEFTSSGGWMGFTDKYWLTALIPDQANPMKARFSQTLTNGQNRYQVDYLGEAVTIPAGGSIEVVDRLFAGAKVVDLLDGYSESYGIPLFDRAVDFGWFYFLTKPMFHVLHFFYQQVGNYGIAILLLTLLVKILFYPLANKSYRSMSQMKKLQPEMVKLRERFGEDKQRMNQELMALYKKEKVNPMSGCLPIIIQIPVFFSLYKVLFVSIEMRHAPFFGWIQDLSAPDPTTIFNLFGLIPWDPPQFLMLGVWPLLMGLTMFLQQRLNPQPADPIQAKVMMFLPLMFIFLFASFPAGLVVYWTWNNILSIAQQWMIMRRMGVKVS